VPPSPPLFGAGTESSVVVRVHSMGCCQTKAVEEPPKKVEKKEEDPKITLRFDELWLDSIPHARAICANNVRDSHLRPRLAPRPRPFRCTHCIVLNDFCAGATAVEWAGAEADGRHATGQPAQCRRTRRRHP
jgi:hypothetical protein